MKPEYALGRTAAKTGRYGFWTPATGEVSFTPEDAAHALAGANPLGARLLLLKFGAGTSKDSPRDELRLLAVELGHAIPLSVLRMAPTNTAVAGISIMHGVVEEVLAPSICITCDGRGWARQAAQWVECLVCEKTGRAQWSPSRKANACGVARNTLTRTGWWRVHEEARRILISEELTALDHMARKLKGG